MKIDQVTLSLENILDCLDPTFRLLVVGRQEGSRDLPGYAILLGKLLELVALEAPAPI